MNFAIEDSSEQSAFRVEVRAFLAASVSPQLVHTVDPCDMSYEQYQLRRDLGRSLGARGWLYPSMPQEYGGGDLSAEKVAILHDELVRVGLSLPPYYDAGGRMSAPTILVWGTPAHKERFLPPICRGEVRTWRPAGICGDRLCYYNYVVRCGRVGTSYSQSVCRICTSRL